jgi:hypothetical protein
MKVVSYLSTLAIAGVITFNANAQFADSVVSYVPGAGASAPYNNASTALGSPTVFIGYQNSDPFNPPYDPAHLVSVGTGGSLTVHLSMPVSNVPHPYGIDFMIYGNAGFIITNGDYSGGGITDGSLFAANTGSTEVWVSSDNLSYYRLDPTKARTVDTLFPVDSAGNFQKAVDPSLTGASFAGLDINGIRSLYNGAGGGAGYDLSWAQDGLGNPVFLTDVSFVRVVGLSGKAEIDAFAVVPEPTLATLAVAAIGLVFMRSRKLPLSLP